VVELAGLNNQVVAGDVAFEVPDRDAIARILNANIPFLGDFSGRASITIQAVNVSFAQAVEMVKRNYAQVQVTATLTRDQAFNTPNDLSVTPVATRAAGILADRNEGSGFGISNTIGVFNLPLQTFTPSPGLPGGELGTVSGGAATLAALKVQQGIPLTPNERNALNPPNMPRNQLNLKPLLLIGALALLASQ